MQGAASITCLYVLPDYAMCRVSAAALKECVGHAYGESFLFVSTCTKPFAQANKLLGVDILTWLFILCVVASNLCSPVI